MNWIPAILAIGALIVVHEAGHYVVARLCGMRVERFSIGFGPAILSWRSPKTGTKFQLAPIPFGGFVEIKGMNILEEIDPADRSAYPNRPAWQRFATIFAGPATNYLFAVVLAFVLFAVAGQQDRRAPDIVGKTQAGYAAHGELEPGDRVVAVDGEPLDLGRSLTSYFRPDPERERVLTIERSGQTLQVPLQPRYDPETKNYRIGIEWRPRPRVDVGVGAAAKDAIAYPVVQTQAILSGLHDWIFGDAKGEMRSVVGITQIVAETIEEGWVDALLLLMLLNVYLGLFNLFPLPALDGGRLVFLTYEMVTRRRANPKLEATIHMIGVLALVVLLVVVTFNDVRRL
jgi:regulator of sigma E protease